MELTMEHPPMFLPFITLKMDELLVWLARKSKLTIAHMHKAEIPTHPDDTDKIFKNGGSRGTYNSLLITDVGRSA